SSKDSEAEIKGPMEIGPSITTNSPEVLRLTELCAVFTSLVAVVVARKNAPPKGTGFRRGFSHVSRQSSNPGRRERPSQGPGRVQAGDRREVWPAILYHQPGWQGCSSVSLRGMGADRAEAGRALQFQSYEEEVSRSDELLRAAGRDGWAGA